MPFQAAPNPRNSTVNAPMPFQAAPNPRGRASTVEAPMPFQAAPNPRLRNSTVDAPMPFQAAPNPRLRNSTVEAPMPFQAAPNPRLRNSTVEAPYVMPFQAAPNPRLTKVEIPMQELVEEEESASPSVSLESDTVRMPTIQPVYESTIDDSAFDVGPDLVIRRESMAAAEPSKPLRIKRSNPYNNTIQHSIKEPSVGARPSRVSVVDFQMGGGMVFRNPRGETLEEDDPIYNNDELDSPPTPDEMPAPPAPFLNTIPSNPLISKNSVVIKNYEGADSDLDTDSF